MTAEQTAQQLELAAQILRTGHPFEVRHDTSDRWQASLGVNPAQAVLQDWHLRPVLATPPYPAQFHNPDNLTAEQVGVGYRLALPGEKLDANYDYWLFEGGWKKGHGTGVASELNHGAAMRLPLSVPWPELPDPYAKLKAAHAAGKVIQWFNGTTWIDLIKPVDPSPLWLHPAKDLRIKPEEPAFQLPPPPPGMRWHRMDGWKADDLPQGYRPLVVGEKEHGEDEFCSKLDNDWMPTPDGGRVVRASYKVRTRRPLTFTHAGRQWTWHRPGDPMPCDGERRIECVFADGSLWTDGDLCGKNVSWTFTGGRSDIIGWRYAEPQTKTVPLGPEDVPPGSAVTTGKIEGAWAYVVAVDQESVLIPSRITGKLKRVTYEKLRESRKVNRSIPLTGKWNPDAWEPCSKEIPADENLAEPKSR